MALVTHETARAAAAKANQVRWSRWKAEQAKSATPAITPAITPPVPELVADEFIKRKLARVRGQIERIDGLMEEVTEPQAADRFCAALARLYEIERILAGRPLPGSMRPTKAQSSQVAWPIVEQQQPTVAAPASVADLMADITADLVAPTTGSVPPST